LMAGTPADRMASTRVKFHVWHLRVRTPTRSGFSWAVPPCLPCSSLIAFVKARLLEGMSWLPAEIPAQFASDGQLSHDMSLRLRRDTVPTLRPAMGEARGGGKRHGV
jgi:hypothetical protein